MINTTTSTIVKIINVTVPVYSVTYYPAGKDLVIGSNGSIVFLNLDSDSVVGSLPLRGAAYYLTYDYADGDIYAIQFNSTENPYYLYGQNIHGYILAINPKTLSIIGNFSLGNMVPYSMYTFPSSPLVFIVSYNVTIFNPLNDSFIHIHTAQINNLSLFLTEGLAYNNYTGSIYLIASILNVTSSYPTKSVYIFYELDPISMTLRELGEVTFNESNVGVPSMVAFDPTTSTFYINPNYGDMPLDYFIYLVKLPGLYSGPVLLSIRSSSRGVGVVELSPANYLISNVTVGSRLSLKLFINSTHVIAYLNGTEVAVESLGQEVYLINLIFNKTGVYNLNYSLQ
ncbi:hypothetical protein [Caldivirga sp.]|uniref:hypothetical protein n=1 Tax=Caldivirga sp. TaxID=2080243 RepID=UPI003D138C20